MNPLFEKNEQLKRDWTDQYVKVKTGTAELKRFSGVVGRVVTINWNNRAVVDFQDGGWYDILPDFLEKVDATEGKANYKNVNSAQPIPEKQGA